MVRPPLQAPFWTPEDEAHFRSRHSDKKFLDPSFKSCTKLIATIAASRFGFDPGPLEDLIHWADIVDGALYASAQAAVEVGEPAQKLAAVIEANKDTSFSHRIIRQLSQQPLNQVATQAEVLDRYRPLHQHHTENIRIIREVSECSRGVTFFDLIPFGLEGYNKFIPYYLHPESDYHVSLMQPPERTKVSVGWNPWSPNRRRHNLARICERYGGGGHPVVAAISLPPRPARKSKAGSPRDRGGTAGIKRVIHEGPRRTTKGLEENPEGSAMGRERGRSTPPWERGRLARTKTTWERGRPARTKTTWERGRPARTRPPGSAGVPPAQRPGTMEEIPVKAGSARFAREWPWMAGCLQE